MSAVIARYYHSLDREKRTSTLRLARTMLDPAIADFGHVRVDELRPIVVTEWLAKMSHEKRRKGSGREKPWNQSTRNTACCVLNRAFSWAQEQKLIAANPRRRVQEAGETGPRGFAIELRPTTYF
jgi:hypothetical protein